MLDILNTLGGFMRSALAVGFAALWGWFSVFLNGWSGIGSAATGLAVMALAVALGALAIVIGFSCLLRLTRGTVSDKVPAPVSPRWFAATPEPDFDPDAIIARHLALRAAQRAAMLTQRSPRDARHPQRAQHFGRRGLSTAA